MGLRVAICAEVPGQPYLVPTSGDAQLVALIWRAPLHGDKTIGATHRDVPSNIVHAYLLTHRSNRYCFRFAIQSKWSLHRLSVETGNTDLTWLGQSCIHLPRHNTYGVKRWDFYFQNVIFAMNEAHNLFKTLQCMFCGVSPSDLSRNMDIKHRGVLAQICNATPVSRQIRSVYSWSKFVYRC